MPRGPPKSTTVWVIPVHFADSAAPTTMREGRAPIRHTVGVQIASRGPELRNRSNRSWARSPQAPRRQPIQNGRRPSDTCTNALLGARIGDLKATRRY
jgi:hypothetical protein